jgi:hypothetical protein
MKVNLIPEMKGKRAADENSKTQWPTQMVSGKPFTLNVRMGGGFSTLPIGNDEFIVIPAGFVYEPADEPAAPPVVTEPVGKRSVERPLPSSKPEGPHE